MEEPAVPKARSVLEFLNQDAHARQLYQERLKGMQTYISDIEGAREEGLEQGVEQGREEGREEGRTEEKRVTARKLLAIGLPVEQIAQVTGLSLAEIDRLRQ
jgi:predicted transposase/invertase (TIGR01784 family)